LLLGVILAAGLLTTACQQAPAAPAAQPAAATTAPPPTAANAPSPAPAKPAASPAASPSPSAVASPSIAASPAASPAASQPAPAAAAAPTPTAVSGPPASLKVSYSNPIATNLPEWMALETGAFTERGLTVEETNIASATGIPALLSGDTQIAHLGGSEVVSADSGGADLVIIGVTGPVYPFVFMAQPSITSVDQLKGKKIGVSNAGSSSDIATRVMLKKVGLVPDQDVTIVPVGSLQNRTAALLSGAIDGGLAQPPEQLALEDKGLHIIYDLAAQHLPAATDIVVVQRSWLNANREVAQRYVDALVVGASRAHQDRAKTLTVLGKYLNTDDQRALATTYDFFVNNVMPVYPMPAAADFADAIEQLSASNDKVKGFDASTIIDTSLVQGAMDRHLAGS
jgi:NitT/TauT family transport system substrate-binding protein